MSEYIEYKDRVAFHPGYYIKEMIEDSGLTQEDFAKRLDTTPKNLSKLVNGEQRLSIDIAMKLSRMSGTSIEFWLNLQEKYDLLIAEFESDKLSEKESEDYKNYFDYTYFKTNFNLPSLPRKINEQINEVRKFLNVATLSVFTVKDMAVSFRNEGDKLTEANVVRANVMVQIAVNETLRSKTPAYDRKKFENAVQYALTLTRNHEEFYPLIKKAFYSAGVSFIILPNLTGSKTNGATKKVGDSVMLMVDDRRSYSDTFWFTLFHEIGHILHSDFGITFEHKESEKEEAADKYAEDSLIPPEKYKKFLSEGRFDLESVKDFAEQINRDPGIIYGRLQNDGIIKYNDNTLKSLRKKYRIEPIYN